LLSYIHTKGNWSGKGKSNLQSVENMTHKAVKMLRRPNKIVSLKSFTRKKLKVKMVKNIKKAVGTIAERKLEKHELSKRGPNVDISAKILRVSVPHRRHSFLKLLKKINDFGSRNAKMVKSVRDLEDTLRDTLCSNEENMSSLLLKQKELKVKIASLQNENDGLNNKSNSLKEWIECPVCLDIPRASPVYVCPNGHTICKICKRENCPTCRVAMGTGKSILAVAILDIIDHKCRFSDCEKLFSLDKLENHEKICEHRIIKCPYNSCGEQVSLSRILDHFSSSEICSTRNNPIVIDSSSKDGFEVFRVADGYEDNDSYISWRLHILTYKESNFAIYSKKEKEFYYISMIGFESSVKCTKFKVELVVHEWDSEKDNSDLSLSSVGNPCSIDECEKDWQLGGIVVNSRAMAKIIKTSGSFGFVVSFRFCN